MALVGFRYIQSSTMDPGAVGFGYQWAQTDTGNLYERNTSNTAWVIVGNINQTYLGQLNRGGGTTTGAILGAHGLMPLAGADFTSAPTINGNVITTQAYVDQRDNYVLSQISPQVQAALASLPGTSINSNVVIWTGQAGGSQSPYNANIVIPITETYPDGTTIQKADCQSFASIGYGGWQSNNGDALAFTLTQVDNMTWQAFVQRDVLFFWPAMIDYIVIAIKPGS